MRLEESQVLTSDFPILPSYRNKNSMVLTQEKKYRTMEQDIKSHPYSQSTTKEARIYNQEKTVTSITGHGKPGQLHVEK